MLENTSCSLRAFAMNGDEADTLSSASLSFQNFWIPFCSCANVFHRLQCSSTGAVAHTTTDGHRLVYDVTLL